MYPDDFLQWRSSACRLCSQNAVSHCRGKRKWVAATVTGLDADERAPHNIDVYAESWGINVETHDANPASCLTACFGTCGRSS